MQLVFLAIFTFCSLYFLLCSLFQLYYLIKYIIIVKTKSTSDSEIAKLEQFPFVTIQLPIYNELYVVERLLNSICEIDYPQDKLEIQVLDDSTDETFELIAKKVAELQLKDINIIHIHRSDRQGFKAGALREGLHIAKGEFIAIFDADFLPNSLFLQKTLPWFSNQKIGIVQTRWGHINRNFSLLTQLQALALDAHFTIEQSVREISGYFLNFNGTGGVWRKSCILGAGNWSGDTLTEDLDLSYRAQLSGWKIKYLEDVISPAELPVNISSIRNQQFRWIKGGAQNFILNFRRLESANISLNKKMHGLFHLFSSSSFFVVLLMALLSIPTMIISSKYNVGIWVTIIGFFFLIPTFILMVYYAVPYLKANRSNMSIFVYLFYFFMFIIFMMGLSFSNSVGVLEAYLGVKSSFVRTPKYNIRSKRCSWEKNKYLKNRISILHVFEAILAILFFITIIYDFKYKMFGFVYFHTLMFMGFSTVSFLTIRDFILYRGE